jgi:hypothetical protein
MTKKVVRKKGKIEWSEISFERSGGFKAPKFDEPTLKSSKHGIALYKTDLKDGDHVRLFSNGKRVAIMVDERGAKKVKSNKSGSRVQLSGKKVVAELKLEPGTILPGQLGEVNGKVSWIFE